MREPRAELIEEVKSTRERQIREQEAQMERERQDIEKYFEKVRLNDEQENMAEARRQQKRREDNIRNRHVLAQQMKEAEHRSIVEDVTLAEPEKQMNAALLEQAALMVGYQEDPHLLCSAHKI